MKIVKVMAVLLMLALALVVCAGLAFAGDANDMVRALNARDANKIEKLLKANPKFATMKWQGGWTVLHSVAKDEKIQDREKLAKLLLSQGANPNAKDEYDNTPVTLAAIKQNLEMVKLLVSRGGDINQKDKYGNTVLHTAALLGHREMVEFFISKGMSVNAKGQNNETPLFKALAYSQRGMVEFLIAKGANVNAKDKEGWTPLHHAACQETTEMAELLLAHGANKNIKNKRGMTPLGVILEPDEYNYVEHNPAMEQLLQGN